MADMSIHGSYESVTRHIATADVSKKVSGACIFPGNTISIDDTEQNIQHNQIFYYIDLQLSILFFKMYTIVC